MPKLPRILSHVSPLISLPARVQNYLDAQSGKLDAPYLLPLSCSLIYGDTLPNILKAAIWIKRGAGVKLILPEDLPTACSKDSHTTIQVQDSLLTDPLLSKGEVGIYEALCLKATQGVDLDFSLLRPKGSPCRGGIKASGRESFEVLSSALDSYRYEPNMRSLLYLIGLINQIMIQGGFKKGIITTSYPASGKLLDDYLSVDLGQIPGSLKREVRFSEGIKGLEEFSQLSDRQKFSIAEARNFSSLMLAKEKSDSKGRKLFTNVCEGIYLKPDDSCLIIRIPLGRLTIDQIVPAYKQAYKFGKALWHYWHKNNDCKLAYSFNDADTDKQIAIDPFGLANLLAYYGVRYNEFISALKEVREAYDKSGKVSSSKKFPLARQIAVELWKAHLAVAKLNKGFFERVFTVEPSQSHAFRELDHKGFTFARGIWAVWNEAVERDSNHEGSKVYHYPNFETIRDHDAIAIQEGISREWFLMMEATGLSHAVSHDTYYEFSVDTLADWLLYSPLPSLYYDFHREVNQIVAKTVEEISFEGIDLSPACDPTAGFCEICGA